MYAELFVDRPVADVLGDWDILDDLVSKKFSRFKRVGDGILGVRRRLLDGNEVVDPVKGVLPASLEMGPNGIFAVHHEVLTLRMTAGGTPHRVPHNFGFWHINDMDELYLTLPPAAPGQPAYMLVIMQHPEGAEGESFAEYCEECLTLIFERHYNTGRLGFEGFFKANDEAIIEYNSDVRFRTCPECGHVNPLGYTWNPGRDTPATAAARLQW